MKFTCTQENLKQALQHASGAAGKNIHLPILNNILVQVSEGSVVMTTTNLEMAVQAKLRAKVETTGTFTVPAKTISDYIQLISGDQITVELQDNELVVSSGKSKTKIKGNPADEFPVIPSVEQGVEFVLDTKEFKTGLAKVLFACSRSEVRPELSGVYFQFNSTVGTLTMAATDSYRLAEIAIPIAQTTESEPKNVIIPHRTLFEVARVMSADADKQVTVKVDESQVVFVVGDVVLTSRLIEGKYPDYRQIIPQESKTKAVFLTDALVKEVKAASLFASQGINAVSIDCNVGEGTIGISSTSTQLGEHTSSLAADMTGDEASTLLNFRYVLDGLNAIGVEETEIQLNEATTPVLLRPKGGADYNYIVMPIRQ